MPVCQYSSDMCREVDEKVQAHFSRQKRLELHLKHFRPSFLGMIPGHHHGLFFGHNIPIDVKKAGRVFFQEHEIHLNSLSLLYTVNDPFPTEMK